MRCVGLMRETALQTFGRSVMFTVKIAGAFKTEAPGTEKTEKRFNYMGT